MSLLLANGLKRHYGATEVLRGADLRVEPGDKIGIVGRNGAGKTTLLRLIEGVEQPDAGSLRLAKGARLGFVNQRPEFAPGVSVRAYVETGLDEVHRIAAELEQAAEEMSTADGGALERLMKRHGELSERMEFLGGWEAERRVETVLSGIGLPTALWDREPSTLSGGEKSRTALARELVSTPDLLLLDEPTNHLDLVGIEWLESYLTELRGAVIIVSHDRRLLTNVVSAIVELERGEMRRYPGNYPQYLYLRDERFASELRAYENQRDTIRKEQTFIKKHMGSQRTSEAKGRQKRLSRVERLERPYNDVRAPVIRLVKAERGGELVLDARGLKAGYDGRVLFEGVDVRIGRGERIGIVGPNGAGKTTLLKLLAGLMRPLAGEIMTGHKARCGYFDQETEDLNREATVYQTIQRLDLQRTDLEIRSHLARFLFRGEDIDAVVGTLSGGERARLYLARLLLDQPTWLAFDEPTNHLDLAARTALEEFLGEFQGALVCISHDRQFLDGLCTSILEVNDGAVTRYAGNYSDYRAALAAQAEKRGANKLEAERREAAAKRKAAADAAAKLAKQSKQSKQAKQTKQAEQAEPARHAEQPRRPDPRRDGKAAKKKPRNPYMLEKLEQAIMQLEEQRAALLAALGTEEVYRDANALRETQFALAELERDLEHKNAEWESWEG